MKGVIFSSKNMYDLDNLSALSGESLYLPEMLNKEKHEKRMWVEREYDEAAVGYRN